VLAYIIEQNDEYVNIFKELLRDDFKVYSTNKNLECDLQVSNVADLIIGEYDEILEILNNSKQSEFVLNMLHRKPVLVVSKSDRSKNLEDCMNSWADDYITKPFNINLFRAKARSLARKCKPITVDPVSFTITRDGVMSKTLTAIEFRLVNLLLNQPSFSCKVSEVSQNIWGGTFNRRLIISAMSRLRPKIRGLALSIFLDRDKISLMFNDQDLQ
jgi:response regulator RpfG family c-di-GMP phosphodiesterase